VRLSRWMVILLMTMAFAALAAGGVMAAPAAAEQTGGVASVPWVGASSDVTSTITTTRSFTQPVALEISNYFGISYTEVISLHQSGLGFGEITRIFMIAKLSGGKWTADQVLALRESGLGWGQIMKQTEFRPGGNGLGAIMSGHGTKSQPPSNSGANQNRGNSNSPPGNSNRPDCPGNSCKAPGHGKSTK
jgi:hypothetical protein